MNWKRKAYASMASVQHYIIIAPDKVEVLQFSREMAWSGQRLSVGGDAINFPEWQFSLSFFDVYRSVVF